MTTIKSVFEYSPQTLLVETGKHEGETYLRINSGKSPMGDAMVATADLLAALDAVPREKLSEAEDDAATAQAELRAATAERDALAATMERVREVLDGIGRNSVFVHEVRAALDPEPAFVLPTEAGVRFEATDNLGHEVTFRAVWNGPHIMYLNESTSVIWNRDNLLAGCTDFRLLGAAE